MAYDKRRSRITQGPWILYTICLYIYRGERLVSDLVNGLRNNKLTVHHATLRSHAQTFITRFNRYSLPIHLLKDAA